MHAGIRIVALVFWCAIVSLTATASGSYSGGGVRPPVKIDSARYELGKAVFTGKAKLSDTPANAEAQTTQLSSWHKALPASVQKTANLPSLAGRLSDAQLSGLEHYLQIRYNINPSAR
jgi:hypothetical protein